MDWFHRRNAPRNSTIGRLLRKTNIMNIKKFLIYVIVGGIIMTILRYIGPNSFGLGWIGGILFYAAVQLIDLYFEDDKD